MYRYFAGKKEEPNKPKILIFDIRSNVVKYNILECLLCVLDLVSIFSELVDH